MLVEVCPILRICFDVFQKVFSNCNRWKIKVYQDCHDKFVLIFSTH